MSYWYFIGSPSAKNIRSSHQYFSLKKAVRNNFAIFTGKDLSWSLILIKLQALRTLKLQVFKTNTWVFLRILRNV